MAQTKIKAGLFEGIIGNGTDGYFLMSNGDGTMTWSSTITNPTITSIAYPGSVTAADPAGGETITVTGTGFKTGATVTIGGTTAPAVSYVSATQITFTTPAKAAGDYDIVFTNADTGSATYINGISYNGIPTWTTPAGSLGTFASDTTISTITLQATEPDAGTITFSITNGALPTGLSLTGANIDGTTTLETADTLYTFTVTATDDESQATPRTFTITVQKALINTDNFEPVLYTGNGSTQSISSLDFQPDLVWIKGRSSAWPHRLQDSVRGATKYLDSATANNEATSANTVTSFDTNGFTLGADGNVNAGYGNTYVAWCWKAGGAAVSGTGTGGASSVSYSANTNAGFSIVKYTKSGTSGTMTHGLTSAPEIILEKRTDGSTYWNGRVEGITANNQTLYLNQSSEVGTHPSLNLWTTPTTSVFGYDSANAGAGDYIAYCFHSVAGYQKVGTYTGTGTNLNTINVGFQPRFVLFKRTDSTGSWRMFDSIRGTDKSINANLSDAEYDDTQNYVDFISNGFEFNRTVSQANPDINASGGTYIYLAIA